MTSAGGGGDGVVNHTGFKEVVWEEYPYGAILHPL